MPSHIEGVRGRREGEGQGSRVVETVKKKNVPFCWLTSAGVVNRRGRREVPISLAALAFLEITGSQIHKSGSFFRNKWLVLNGASKEQ